MNRVTSSPLLTRVALRRRRCAHAGSRRRPPTRRSSRRRLPSGGARQRSSCRPPSTAWRSSQRPRAERQVLHGAGAHAGLALAVTV